MTEEFRNAYHFIARKAKAGRPFPNAKHFGKDGNHSELGHAVYVKDCLSGTIHCRVTLEQPTVIGGVHHSEEDHYTVIEPYTLFGEPAIPGTSLKGLLSSLAEAASQSAYRVIDTKTPLTVAWYVASPVANKKGKNQRPEEIGIHLGPVTNYTPLDSRPHVHASMADLMFGFVRDKKASGDTLQALAGRIRISDARLEESLEPAYVDGDSEFAGETYENGTFGQGYHRLKELAQPMKGWTSRNWANRPADEMKFRSATPNLYFKNTAQPDLPISKKDFAEDIKTSYEIQGQKAYLHHAASSAPDAQPWKTRNTVKEDRQRDENKGPPAGRKSVVKPLRTGTQFTFDVRFDNLSAAELDLLSFAIRPSEAFRHKIGYGKPLGLGSVKIDPIGLTLIDRTARYTTESVFGPRHEPSEALDPLFGEGVARCAAALASADPAALNAILLIGETHDFGGGRSDTVPVLWVPLTEARYADLKAGRNAEDKSFAWFQANDKRGNKAQRLRPITASDTEIPTLWTGVKGIRRAPAKPAARAPDRYAGIIQPFSETARTRLVVEEDNPTPGVATILPDELAALRGPPLQAGDRIEFSVKESPSKKGQMLAFAIVRL